MAFLAAKKTRVINSFMVFLLSMILTTGGSFFMRIQIRPSVNFWHHISLLGMFMIPVAFLHFILNYLDEKKGCGRYFWTVFFVIAYVVNAATNYFIPLPVVETSESGAVSFVYNYGTPSIVIFAGVTLAWLQATRIFIRYSKGDALMTRQLLPLILGGAVQIAGTVLATLPIFSGFPVDIVASFIFAYLVIYAMYRRRLFKLSILASPGTSYVVAMLLGLVAFYKFILPYKDFIGEKFRLSESLLFMYMTIVLMLMIYIVYRIMKQFLETIFVKEEEVQSETIKEFSYMVSKTLNKQEILGELIEVIQKMVPVEKAYICIRDNEDNYIVEQSLSALDRDITALGKDHPLVTYMNKNDGYVMMEDFCRTSAYRTMWESEKDNFRDKNLQCFVPMKASDEMIGILLLSAKRKEKPYTSDDMSLLTSVCSICSMAVKNSKLYEKAYEEARKDELTNLYNRKYFYETLYKMFEGNDDKSLALILLNIDDFKLYNQLYGNEEGDIAITKIARIISASVEGRGIAFRMVGKEFAVLLPEYDVYSAKVLAESILEQVRRMNSNFELYSLKVLTMSIGICAYPYMAYSADELVSNADFAVYSAKRSGKNKVVCYSEEVAEEEQVAAEPSERTSRYDDYASTVYALTAAIDTKDHYTFNHSQNVAYYASELAKACGMNQEFVTTIKEAGLLHDIGKIGIREDILNKPDKLNSDEYEIMKTHVENSVGIVKHLPSLDYVIPAVISHHERYDGKGYPRGISGEAIPLMGRMLCVADSFDAMISRRSYKRALAVDRALEIINDEKGKQFDPKLAEVFIHLVQSDSIEIRVSNENFWEEAN